jgi:hypothetical protein
MSHIKIILFICLALFFNAINAITIKGTIDDPHGTGLQDISVILFKMDSTIEKISITNDSGSFEMDDIKEGSYFLAAAAIGYVKYKSGKFELKNDFTFSKIILYEENKLLVK